MEKKKKKTKKVCMLAVQILRLCDVICVYIYVYEWLGVCGT